MGILFGLAVAAASSYLTVQLSAGAFANAGPAGSAVGLAIGILAGVGAFLAGSSAYRRARRTHERLGLFTALAFGFCFAVVGGAFMVALTAIYVGTYSAGQSTAGDGLLTVLAYPILGLIGLCLGAVGGWLVGLVASGALRFLAPVGR